MAQETYNARQVKIVAKIGEVSVPVNSITFTHAIDELPRVEFLVQLDNRDVVNAGLASIGSAKIDTVIAKNLLVLTQEKILNRKTIGPDVSISVEDGEQNQILFKGFLGQPSYHIQEGETYFGFWAVNTMKALQFYTSQIYVLFDNYALPTNFIETTSIAERVMAMTQRLFDRATLDKDVFAEFKAQPIHNLNGTALDLVKRFFEASKESTRIVGLDDQRFAPVLNATIYQILIGAPNMYAAVMEFCRTFRLQLNANWKGDAWLEHWLTVEPAEGRKIFVPVDNINFQVAHLVEPPLVQALVQGPGVSMYSYNGSWGEPGGDDAAVPEQLDPGQQFRFAIASQQNSLKALATYPPTIDSKAVGHYAIVSAPAWAQPGEHLLEDTDPIAAQGSNRFMTTAERMKKMRTVLEDGQRKMVHVLDYLAEATYKDLALRYTNGWVTAPLNVKAQVGRTYDVGDVSKKVMFQGFLRMITHTINLSLQGTATAKTTYEFTHIIAEGAKIDALERAKQALQA